jgi:hypothetical protein
VVIASCDHAKSATVVIGNTLILFLTNRALTRDRPLNVIVQNVLLRLSGPIFCTRRSERVYSAFAASKVEFSPGRIASGAGGR